MITPELISRYPFFVNLKLEDLILLADSAVGVTKEAGKYIFRQGDKLDQFYIVVEGAVGIIRERYGKKDAVISAVGPGHIFAWSTFINPHIATASAKAFTTCWLLGFDRIKLQEAFEKDCRFGYRMMEIFVQIGRDRLMDARIESFVFLA